MHHTHIHTHDTNKCTHTGLLQAHKHIHTYITYTCYIHTSIGVRGVGRRQILGQRDQHVGGLLQVLWFVPVDAVVAPGEAAVVVAWCFCVVMLGCGVVNV